MKHKKTILSLLIICLVLLCAVVVYANSFSISEVQIKFLAAELELSGKTPEEAEERAISLLIKKYAMYNKAISEGYRADEKYVRDLIEENKNAALSADNYNEFEHFLEGINMTNNEYWDSQYDNEKIYEAINLYKEKCRNNFLETADTAKMSEAEKEEAFSIYYSEIVKSVIESENVEIY